jgi:plasmid stabilization system protein ParE
LNYRVSIARIAARDVAGLVDYVDSNSGRAQADEVENAIYQTILSLDRDPHCGPVLRHMQRGVRFVMTSKSTQIFYRIKEPSAWSR